MSIEEMLKSEVKTECCDEPVKPVIIKEESSADAEDYVSPVMCPKIEDIVTIKCEELHIKDEGDIGEEMGDSAPLGVCSKSGQSGSLKRKRQTRKSASKGRTYFSSDGHIARRKGLTKVFGCQECTFKTNRKHILVRHMVRHKHQPEEEAYKCENCEYETRHKVYMKRHNMVKHRDPKAERKFKCDQCSYATDRKDNLRSHNVIHKDKSEVQMYKCENCEYETRHKRNIIQHMVKHRDLRAGKKFKCDKCSYETNFNSNLRSHNLIHRDKVQLHKCENCEYMTRHKGYMKRHNMVKHQSDPKAEENLNVINVHMEPIVSITYACTI